MDVAEPFPDNWTYLRTELNWLDRVLASAIARQRKDTKEIERVARTKADYATSHWWKGLVTLDGLLAGDSPAEPPRRRTTLKTGYQQQMEARIQASHTQGIVLGLPSLCQRLGLSAFEKNLVLMALAPEVNRRYARMYNFLQETDLTHNAGLPTVDLILRLLCRNDAEWRAARLSLASGSCLVQQGLVAFPTHQTEPFLAHPVKLADPLVEYLLAEVPLLEQLDKFLNPPLSLNSAIAQPAVLAAETWQPESTLLSAIAPGPNQRTNDAITAEPLWEKLVLPESLLAELQHLGDRVRFAPLVDAEWGFDQAAIAPGTLALLTGPKGTGKTLAAQAIAQTLTTPLHIVDLALQSPLQANLLLNRLLEQAPTVLLLKSAQRWFGRSSPLPPDEIQRFLDARQTCLGLTLLSLEPPTTIQARWRQQLHAHLQFSVPTQSDRYRLWQQALPAKAPLADDIQWQTLAEWPLSGEAIYAIAREAAIYAAATSQPIGMAQLLQAYHASQPNRRKPTYNRRN